MSKDQTGPGLLVVRQQSPGAEHSDRGPGVDKRVQNVWVGHREGESRPAHLSLRGGVGMKGGDG